MEAGLKGQDLNGPEGIYYSGGMNTDVIETHAFDTKIG